MKKFRLLASTLFFILALTFVCLPSAKVHADGGEPQGTSNTKKAPPPPNADIIDYILYYLGIA